MNNPAELDIGPLTWVKNEIDLALDRAVEAISRHEAEPDDFIHLRTVHNHLHQVHGALSIVGLDGVTRFSEVLEQAVAAGESGDIAFTAEVGNSLREGIAALRHYLDDLVTGQPDQPLRLMPAFRRLAIAKGGVEPNPAELFYPDLSIRPPRREQEPQPLTADELRLRGRAARANFQRGLLKWLKDSNLRGVAEMREAIAAIERTQVQPSARAFWWAALAFLDTIANGSTPVSLPMRRLCARIDIQIRKLIEGSRTVAERLMRDTLYYVAVAGPSTEHVERVRAVYRLAKLVPPPAPEHDIEPLRPALRTCRELLNAAMEDWNRFSAGTVAALPQFHDRVKQLTAQIDALKHPDLSQLADIVLVAAHFLRKEPLSHNDAIALEMATALLLMEHAIDTFHRLGSEFSEQVATITARLNAALQGKPVAALEMPHLDEMSRLAQEKLLMSQVVREIVANQAHIEQVLDGFFRDPTKVADLAGLDKPLKQIEGALIVLGEDRAVALLRECQNTIKTFSVPDYQPQQSDFEDVASKLSALGFFTEQLQHGSADIDAILNPQAPAEVGEEISEPSVEEELAAAQRQAQTLVSALQEQPTDEILRGEIRQSLETVRENAQLVDNDLLVERATAAIAALRTDQPSTEIVDAVAQVAPVEAVAALPSNDAVRLADASSEEIDAELLAIFIEEAHEVLETIGANLPQLADQPHNRDVLTTIRRGFHTLKGSGRMVGLADLGEAAWAVEQVLNRWLQQELEVSPALLATVDQAHRLFSAWVVQLEQGGGIYRDADQLIAACDALKGEPEAPSSFPDAGAQRAPVSQFAAEETVMDFDGEPTQILPDEDEPLDHHHHHFDIGELSIDFPEQEVLIDESAGVEEIAASDSTDFAPVVPEAESIVELPDESTISSPAVEADIGAAAPAGQDLAEEFTQQEAEEVFDSEATQIFEPTFISESLPPGGVPATPGQAESAVSQDGVRIGDLVLSPTLFNLYINEAQSYLITLSRKLGDTGAPQHAQIRAAHTLSGISATAGIDSIHDLAHSLERALVRLSHQEHEPSEHDHLLLARVVGALEGMVGAIAQRRLPQPEVGLAEELNLLGLEPPPEPSTESLAESSAFVEHEEDLEPTEILPEGEPEPATEHDRIPEPEFVFDLDPECAPIPEPELATEPTPVIHEFDPEPASDELVPESGLQPGPAAASLPDPVPSPRMPELPAPAADEGMLDHEIGQPTNLSDDLDPQLTPIFLEEAVDLVRDISTELRNWREQPGSGKIPDHLKRLLHTFKGSARMAGAMNLGGLVHNMETRVEAAVATNAITPGFLDSLDIAFDKAIGLVERIQAGDALNQPVAEALDDELPELVEAPAADIPAITIPEIKTVAPSVEIAPAAVSDAPVVPSPALDIRADGGGEVENQARAMLRVRAEVVDQLVNEAGEIAIARGRIEGEMRALKTSLLDLTENVIRLRKQLREVEIQAESQMQSQQSLAVERNLHFDPLEFDRFTRFQELTRMMAESVNDVATAQQALLQNLDHANAAITAQARLNRELSQALMGVRMMPFDTLADRLYRVVRQTAKELGRRANLDIRGGQTEVDRSVLEKMTGPLEHLLRNAIAHGLETPQRRAELGKPEIGQITLRVAQEGNEVVIELSDDGTGLDLEKIRAKGIARGLVKEGDTVDAGQLYQLIFRSGFSTADELTAVSGRGVGMDVVRSATTSLGGRIAVDSSPGMGATFRVYLPLTLAVTQAVLVRVGSRHYAIPASIVAQASELKPEAMARIRTEGRTTWLGETYPVYYLPRLLGDGEAQPEQARRYWLLLLRAGTQHLAVEVDGLVGNQELVVKNIGPQLARVVGISGATVLGDGEVALILNPIALAGREMRRPTPVAESALTPPVAQSTTGLVMVVDDSLTVRKITGRLLAREGYHVMSAKDGIDALEQMVDVVPDVLLVDIEMPRMDGFDLTRNVRADQRLQKVPIIMITSRIADKHRNYAREIGVNHYLGKPYDEEELLRLIADYVVLPAGS